MQQRGRSARLRTALFQGVVVRVWLGRCSTQPVVVSPNECGRISLKIKMDAARLDGAVQPLDLLPGPLQACKSSSSSSDV
jgi:hypothetical protein